MYLDDHGHPHFHAYHTDGVAKIRIDDLEVIDSDLKRRLGFHPSYQEDEDFEAVVPSSVAVLSGERPQADAVETR